MKFTAPKNPEKYFQESEHAVRHAYAGLDSCWSPYQEALTHYDISQLNQPLTPERKAALNRYLELASKHFDLKFSEATFAGSILQVAYMAIQIYSRNTTIPASCTALVPPDSKRAKRFCIGKERFGIPCGLIVYAGRNQFSHWDEKKPNKVTRAVFDALSDAFQDNPFSDLAFDLGNPTINIYASEILLTALGWNTYDRYLAGMTDALCGVRRG
jgi:hypothetical protein